MVANNHLVDDDGEPTEQVEAIAEEGKPVKTAEDQHVYPVTGATIQFQILLLLAAFYYSMLLTNWGYPAAGDTTAKFFKGSSEASYWMQYVAQWVSMSIYIFSLLAPVCFPDRDFS